MKFRQKQVMFGTFSLMLCGWVLAQTPDTEERLQQMEQKIQSLEKDNAQLKQDFADGKTGQIRVKPAGKEPDLSLGGLLQIQGEFGDKGDSRFGTDHDRIYLRRARINVSGKFLEEFDFKIETDLSGTLAETSALRAQMTDGYVNWNGLDFVNIKVGQFKTPFGYEQLASDPALYTIERSLANDRLTLSRMIGVQAAGNFFDKRLSYAAGVFNGQASNNNFNDDDAFACAGRLAGVPWQGTLFDQDAKWTAGVDGFSSNDTSLAAQPKEFGFSSVPGLLVADALFSGKRSGEGVDTQLQAGPFSLWAEYIQASYEPSANIPLSQVDTSGWYVQTGYFVIPKELQCVAKFDTFDPNQDKSANNTDTWTFGLNWLIKGDDLKLQADYLSSDVPGMTDKQNKFLLRLQVLF